MFDLFGVKQCYERKGVSVIKCELCFTSFKNSFGRSMFLCKQLCIESCDVLVEHKALVNSVISLVKLSC